MTSRGFKNCVQLIEEMVKKGYLAQISESHVEYFIMRNVGADPRTIKKYLELLIEFDFLRFFKKSLDGLVIYQVNLAKVSPFVKTYQLPLQEWAEKKS